MVYRYLKYMMNKLYYHFIEIQIYWGIIGVTIKLIIFTFISIREYKLGITEGILHDIYIYFISTNLSVIIFFNLYIFLSLMLSNFY